MDEKKPEWLRLLDALAFPVQQQGIFALFQPDSLNPDLAMAPYCAPLHFMGCRTTMSYADLEGLHSVSMCLLRQCVEALTLIDLGLQAANYAEPLLTG